jgi:hypothetical protein
MALWTHRAGLSWRQNLNFFERRYDVLRELENKGLLRRFQERRENIAVRLRGPHQLVIFGSEGLSIGMLKPDAEIEVIRAAVETICHLLEPEPRGYPNFRFQWLNAWDTSYDDARRRSAEAFIGADHPARVADFALIVDAKLDAPFDDCHLELGIVDATEAPRRLARGAMAPEETADSPPGLWASDELPPVAIFCDVRLDAWSLVESDDMVASVFATLESARDAADKFVSSMLRPLQGLTQ